MQMYKKKTKSLITINIQVGSTVWTYTFLAITVIFIHIYHGFPVDKISIGLSKAITILMMVIIGLSKSITTIIMKII